MGMFKIVHVLLSMVVIVSLLYIGGVASESLKGNAAMYTLSAWVVIWACISVWQTQWPDMKAVWVALRGA